MLKFYFNTGPNPMKVALFLEESELDYEAVPLDTRKGEQHADGYIAINPNAKAPAVVDGDVTVFDSNAILLYLAEKSGKFLPPAGDAARGEFLSWLMFVATGVGPYSGQSVHFRVHAPEQIPYALNRYAFEAKRHFGILNDQLADRPYVLGDIYTIVDMATWGWARLMPRVLSDEAFDDFPHLKRLVDEITARPAAERAVGLAARHKFKTEMDAESHRNMFPGYSPVAD